MVVFTCNNCGDSLQKPKVAKHYQFQCRRGENLTCVDCHKDFYGQEYTTHTKCISESARYGGQNYVERPGQNKGERKQQEWINIVNGVIGSAQNLSQDERNLLKVLSRHDNIPRKKAKFMNFARAQRSVFGSAYRPAVLDSVWDRLENAFKSATDAKKSQPPSANEIVPGDKKPEPNAETSDTKGDESQNDSVAENENNENIRKEKGISMESEPSGRTNGGGKKKKSHKRPLEETEMIPEVKSPPKKKKSTGEALLETQIPVVAEKMEKFIWKTVISEIVGANEAISLNKLRKRVAKRYMKHSSKVVTFEKAAMKFDKKLPKYVETLENGKVRLKEEAKDE